MKIFFIVFFTLASLNALETSDKLFECTEIFKARKSELLVELERIDEQKQALSALKTATEELLKKREAKASQDEEVVNLKLKEITSKEESIKKMLQKNEETLKEIKDIKMSNITQTFSKMKAASTANVLSEMNPQDAASILSSLNPAVVGAILSKMDPKKASELTLMLAK
ncbi:MAG: PDP protein [Sulfurimonas sp.]|jgi:flagellar motility protein MotE (MotC chaperone)|uniref:MotE family protein n=1 Tax=unclassified Sulfurimonas TaxID=2623549 RepID=UPI0008AFE8F9|nr:PDP protein [Sulfurimonas sp. RIFOXYB12_FULL_35_9]MBS4067139.1 PDP protein [Sulfurimonas sp.]OHE08369.1 MAG: PDP protein [Sulfurimonas sp. RIFOXYB2_FULL_37_5]OHE11219.1 MAG: PDP protein [Sulfurimonas sp. RIFOXYC2_FULL_36_7]OHE13226.1 MAG: PDP protein [Sulfurimonas sp. RIFOXYD12_FULL_36_11]OHE03423.1 MAG: PDP protein [Sulfurimonas sp. RIFOXYB12_FULL_35_9]